MNHSQGIAMRTFSLLLLAPFLLQATLLANRIDTEFNKKLFTLAYQPGSWGSKESRSGIGSTLQRTILIRPFIASLIKDLNIKTFLDAPCGDFNWMKEVNLSGVTYIGMDIVDELIKENAIRYTTPQKQFFACDILHHPLPQVDLILCRDCTQHLPDNGVRTLINNIKKSGSRYLLTSNYPHIEENKDIENLYNVSRITYRNLRKPPFNFPEPIVLFPEGFENKTLCLWEIKDLPLFE
jgi:hypothetical protein